MKKDKFIPCPKCLGQNGKFPLGYIQKKINNQIVIFECDCHKKFIHQEEVKRLFKHYGFNKEFVNYTKRSYVGQQSKKSFDRICNYIEQFQLNEKVRRLLVYMYGPNGCQKTAVANFIGKSLIDRGYTVRYLLMNSLINLLQKVDFKEELKPQLDKINQADLLIIDESFDKEKIKLWKSGYQISFLDSWIRERIQVENRGIIFISNISPTEIEKQGLSHSIQDFVIRETTKNNTFLEFKDNYITSSGKEWSEELSLF